MPPSCWPGSTHTDSDDARRPEPKGSTGPSTTVLGPSIHLPEISRIDINCHAPQGSCQSSVGPPLCVFRFKVCAEVTIQNTGGARARQPLLVPRATNRLGVAPRKAAAASLAVSHGRDHLPGRASGPTPVRCQNPRMRGPSARVTPLSSPHVRDSSKDAILSVQGQCFIKKDCALSSTPPGPICKDVCVFRSVCSC